MKSTHRALMGLIGTQREAILHYLRRKPPEAVVVLLCHDPQGRVFFPMLLPGESEVRQLAHVTFTVGLADRRRIQALLEAEHKEQALMLARDDVDIVAVGFEAFAAATWVGDN